VSIYVLYRIIQAEYSILDVPHECVKTYSTPRVERLRAIFLSVSLALKTALTKHIPFSLSFVLEAASESGGSGSSVLSLRRPLVERLRLTAAAMDASGSAEVAQVY